MLIHILSTFVHKLYMYYKLKYIFSYITWIIFGNLWIPEWPILIDLPIIYTLNQIQYNWFFSMGAKDPAFFFFKGWGGGCSKKIIFIIRGGLTTPIFCKLTNELSLLKFDFQLRLPTSSRTSKITRLAVTLLNYIQALFVYLKYVYLATITQIWFLCKN